MSIRRRNLKSGMRYMVVYRDPSGRQLNKSFLTLREATAFEAEETTRIRQGRWVDPSTLKVGLGDWAAMWLESNPGKRESSKARDYITVKNQILPMFSNRYMNQITPMDVQRAVNIWSTQYAPSTVGKAYRTLAAILRSAVNSDVIVRSPCRAIKLPKVKAHKAYIVNATEVSRLAEAMGNLGLMVYLGAVLGLRWGEVAGLRVCDVDILGRRVVVVQQISRARNGDPIVTEPKTESGARTLSIPNSLAEQIALYFRAQGLSILDKEQLLFSDDRGGPLRYSNWLRRSWTPARAEAQLPSLGFHDLRRANATAMVSGGVDIKTAQRRLGHSDPRMTLGVYAQATPQGDAFAADRLGDSFMVAQ